jgi:hypothetical protein
MSINRSAPLLHLAILHSHPSLFPNRHFLFSLSLSSSWQRAGSSTPSPMADLPSPSRLIPSRASYARDGWSTWSLLHFFFLALLPRPLAAMAGPAPLKLGTSSSHGVLPSSPSSSSSKQRPSLCSSRPPLPSALPPLYFPWAQVQGAAPFFSTALCALLPARPLLHYQQEASVPPPAVPCAPFLPWKTSRKPPPLSSNGEPLHGRRPAQRLCSAPSPGSAAALPFVLHSPRRKRDVKIMLETSMRRVTVFVW